MSTWDDTVTELGRLASAVVPAAVARARADALDQAAADVAPHLVTLRAMVGESTPDVRDFAVAEVPQPITIDTTPRVYDGSPPISR